MIPERRRAVLPAGHWWIVREHHGGLTVTLSAAVPCDSPLEQELVQAATRAWRRHERPGLILLPIPAIAAGIGWVLKQLKQPAIAGAAGTVAITGIALAAISTHDPGGPPNRAPAVAGAPPIHPPALAPPHDKPPGPSRPPSTPPPSSTPPAGTPTPRPSAATPRPAKTHPTGGNGNISGKPAHTPPGQTRTPPGHGGTPPGQQKPPKPPKAPKAAAGPLVKVDLTTAAAGPRLVKVKLGRLAWIRL